MKKQSTLQTIGYYSFHHERMHLHESVRGVVLEAPPRRGGATAALIDQYDSPMPGVKEAPAPPPQHQEL